MNKFLIYIVDDEPTIREGIAMAIENSYLVAPFATAEDALRALAGKPPDLILLDIGFGAWSFKTNSLCPMLGY